MRVVGLWPDSSLPLLGLSSLRRRGQDRDTLLRALRIERAASLMLLPLSHSGERDVGQDAPLTVAILRKPRATRLVRASLLKPSVRALVASSVSATGEAFSVRAYTRPGPASAS